MSRSVREITAELAATGLTPDQMALVTELAVAAASDASGGRSKHAMAQARYRANKVITNDHSDHQASPPIDNSTPPPNSSKPKKASRYAEMQDVPEEPLETAIAFALSKGWDRRRAIAEWGRFRDHSLAKGKKHRNLAAAWRNWVTSPYQQQSKENGRKPGLVETAGRLLAEIQSTDVNGRCRTSSSADILDFGGNGAPPGETVVRMLPARRGGGP